MTCKVTTQASHATVVVTLPGHYAGEIWEIIEKQPYATYPGGRTCPKNMERSERGKTRKLDTGNTLHMFDALPDLYTRITSQYSSMMQQDFIVVQDDDGDGDGDNER